MPNEASETGTDRPIPRSKWERRVCTPAGSEAGGGGELLLIIAAAAARRGLPRRSELPLAHLLGRSSLGWDVAAGFLCLSRSGSQFRVALRIEERGSAQQARQDVAVAGFGVCTRDGNFSHLNFLWISHLMLWVSFGDLHPPRKSAGVSVVFIFHPWVIREYSKF
jgi:hypothetical protein